MFCPSKNCNPTPLAGNLKHGPCDIGKAVVKKGDRFVMLSNPAEGSASLFRISIGNGRHPYPGVSVHCTQSRNCGERSHSPLP